MLSGSSIHIDHEAAATSQVWDDNWKYLHHKLRSITKRRIALEAEETSCLLEAEESKLYRRMGYTSMIEYMERELRWGPHVARERLRVARELISLPQIADAYREGELCFSAVRELTRVATPETEEEFLERAQGKTARQIEHMVAGLSKGDKPDTPPDPNLITKRITLELTVEEYALWRRTRAALEDERGERLRDGEVLHTVVRRANETSCSGEVPRPAVQAAVTTCRQCRRSFTGAAGEELALDPATAERMLCDAEHVGDLECEAPTRMKPNIPRGTRGKVFIRDHFSCVVPGCRAARNLDVHHVRPRACGGDHSLGNLAVLCTGHHQRLHEGLLRVRGRAPDLVFDWCRDDDVESAMTECSTWDFACTGRGGEDHDETHAAAAPCTS